MAFPITPINDANLLAGSNSPSAARADLLTTVQNLNAIITEANTADGVLVLNNLAQVPGENMPSIIAPTTGVLTLTPDSKTVKIEDVLRLQLMPVSVLLALPAAAEGDVAYCPNGANGSACVAVYTGNAWQRVTLGAAIAAS